MRLGSRRLNAGVPRKTSAKRLLPSLRTCFRSAPVKSSMWMVGSTCADCETGELALQRAKQDGPQRRSASVPGSSNVQEQTNPGKCGRAGRVGACCARGRAHPAVAMALKIDSQITPKGLLPRVERLLDLSAGKILSLEKHWNSSKG